MNKKMTFKEFKEVLEKAETDFDVFGFEGILNIISLANKYMAEESTRPYVKNMHKRISQTIYDELKERGYYE